MVSVAGGVNRGVVVEIVVGHKPICSSIWYEHLRGNATIDMNCQSNTGAQNQWSRPDG
jgi:hypothetical protein